jgi:hypothetical protein
MSSQIRNVTNLSPKLDGLARRTRQRWNSLSGHVRGALEDALLLGGLLELAKAQLRHGEFGKWLERCGGIPHRTADLYMQLYDKRGSLPVRIDTIRAARAFIQKSRELTDYSPIEAAVIEEPSGPGITTLPVKVTPFVHEIRLPAPQVRDVTLLPARHDTGQAHSGCRGHHPRRGKTITAAGPGPRRLEARCFGGSR